MSTGETDVDKLIAELRAAGDGRSEASRILSDSKAARNRAAGEPNAYYEYTRPEQTCEHRAADLITRLRSQGAVPEGWKLVPVAPTPEMLVAGAWARHSGACDGSCEHVGYLQAKACWPAMLSASPLASATPQSGDHWQNVSMAPVINFSSREDGGLRIWSDDIPGLVLSHADPAQVLRDLGPAIGALLEQNGRQTGKDTLSSVVEAARAEEREWCARVAEAITQNDDSIDRQVKRQVAAAIRARSGTGGNNKP